MGWGTPCQSCPAPGSPEFDSLCPHGAGFTNGGDDINECAQDPNICENGACENMLGGYRSVRYKQDSGFNSLLNTKEFDANT